MNLNPLPALGHALGAVGGGIGKGFGWLAGPTVKGLGGIGHGLLGAGGWAAGQVGTTLGVFAKSWGLFLGKVYGPGLKWAGKTLAPILGKGLKGFVGAAGKSGMGLIGAVAAAGLGWMWLMSRLGGARSQVTRRVSRVSRRTGLGFGTASTEEVAVVTSTGGGGGLLQTAVLLIVLWLLLSMAFPQASSALRGKIQGSAYTCTTTQPQDGFTAIAAGLGKRIHDFDPSKAPTPKDEYDAAHRLATWVGRMWQTFLNSRASGVLPTKTIPPSVASQVSTCGSCSGGLPPGGVPASWPVTDTAAMIAVRAAQAAGFTGQDLVTAVAVAGAESGWQPTATNHNTNGSTDYGMWQINSVHGALLTQGDWRSPVDNARMALQVSGGTNWSPWTTYNSGAYTAYLAQATEAVRKVGGFVGPVVAAALPTTAPVAACPTPTSGSPVPAGTPVVEAAIAFARAQEGDPYVWGGMGPDAWDCSGLVGAAYAAAGIHLPGRPTTDSLLASSLPRVGQAEMMRGDLVMTSIGHVGIYLGGGMMVVAPHAGDVVKEEPVYAFYTAMRVVGTAGVPA